MQYGVSEMIVKPTSSENLFEKVGYALHDKEEEGVFEEEALDSGKYNLTLFMCENPKTCATIKMPSLKQKKKLRVARGPLPED